ncbi:D-proline reductase (dithiol) proprotein PrdA [[Clostridium] scindens]|uniref:D-proline reductase (dithiol) proprotein PrdA n=1 Tax=Clostridium scindens (strain JCM 10418 / VPI 12708) TaxID=29347 RepID=UPI001D0631FF|nr:D-proline reductase (dithiol) proprotein PrdA [[Clostridium] scindens]MCB6643777.1 D-proline reductase (dithiol) proprotein PrdA [[Clostridium] scindens]
MSISVEYANEHKDSPAVLCCRAEEGTVLSAHNLEDPAIFDDLEDSGLLSLEGALSIGQVLGARLTKTADSLTPVTLELVDQIQEQEEETEGKEKEEAYAQDLSEAAAQAAYPYSGIQGANTLKLHIGEGKEIDIELPLGGYPTADVATLSKKAATQEKETVEMAGKDILAHELTKYIFPIHKVILGNETKIEDGVLTVRKTLEEDAKGASPIIKDVKVDLITPDNQDVYTNSMMDICPIAVKKEGKLGEGVTYEAGGVVVMLTGVEESGKQCSDAASSDGIFSEKVIFGRPGAPDKDDIVIRVHVVIEDGYQMERPGPMAAHKAADILTQEIREALRELDKEKAAEKQVLDDIKHSGKPRVLYVKEIMGQGAMHDNLILPEEPCGYVGARPNVDLGNVPVFLRVNEVRDGGIHALTCITPDTKETTRLYFREPIIDLLAHDPQIHFLGVLFVGSPQACTEKFYVSERVGAVVESMNIDGCIVSTEGFGNNHVDFASHIEQIGRQGIPVVGTSFCGIQGALVVGNKYMDTMVDMCVSEDGWETDNLCENQMTPEVAQRCVAMMKNKMMGRSFKKAERQWSQAVADSNAEKIKEA